MSEKKNDNKLTKKDINRVIRRWYISTEMSLNFERMQSIAFTYSLYPILRKLYPNDQDFKESLKRHLELFNTNATAGGLILGTVLAMEEEKANDNNGISNEAIVSIKTGLMGPVAAFGDSFSAGTITTLFILASCSLASQGSILGLILLFIGTLVTLFELIITTKLTYSKGKYIIKDILSSSLMKDVIYGANILGMGMMGALCASMVALNLNITVNFNEALLNVQEKIDNIMPGILPISALFIYYFLISKKKISVAKLVLFTIIISIILSLAGIL